MTRRNPTRAPWILAAFGLSLLLWSAPAAADPPQSLTPRAKLERILNAVEGIPGARTLKQLFPDVAHLLRQIVERPSRRALSRTRALTVLRHFPSPETEATLAAAVAQHSREGKGLALLDLQQALSSYAVVKGPKALDLVQPFLAHPSRDVRYEAAEAVRLSRSPRAEAVLQARLSEEKAPMVRHQLQRQITLTRRPPPQKATDKR